MTDHDTLLILSEILGDLLGDESLTLTPATRREDVPDWDSLTYVNFIAMVEMRFGIKFKVSEIESFGDVASVVTGINAKLASK
jgi:acyl carrier protein